MSKIIVIGAGIVGLSTALILRRQGHDVTVLERDDEALPGSPDDAWETWDRRGITQFRQAHFLHAGGCRVLESLLPDVKEALVRAGGHSFNMLALMPPTIEDREPRPGDERFVTVTGRRPVIEYAVATIAEASLDIRRGVAVTELLTGAAAVTGVPHVTGVRTSDGKRLDADLVIDAMGRRSPLPAWLGVLGARPLAEEAQDSGFIYYTRYFRSATGAVPPARAGLVTPFDSFTLLTLPADAGTWSVTICISTRDKALKEIRHPDKWTAVVSACPLHAHLLNGDPITEVLAMSGLVDRVRNTVVDGKPVVTGIITAGDATCCTNPSLGRGLSMGLIEAAGTAKVVRDHLDDPLTIVMEHEQMIQAEVIPWYRHTVEFDHVRRRQLEACMEGRPAPEETGPAARGQQLLGVAMFYDPDVYRAMMEMLSMQVLPEHMIARPGFLDRVMIAADGREAPPAPPGPSRDHLLRALA
jgi:2-polyprenyl-6-methoxyphenol hydroxylase-like FAD-dependent oxidoreductase